MTSEGSKSRIKWEGDSLEEIKSWAKEARANLGLELHRLDNYEKALDSKPLGKVLPLYVLRYGWVYVLHCFKKKTNKISKNDVKVAKQRLAEVERRDKPSSGEEKKSA
jgi:phage-related protein